MKKIKKPKTLAMIGAYASVTFILLIWSMGPMFTNEQMNLFLSLIFFGIILYTASISVLFTELICDLTLKGKKSKK